MARLRDHSRFDVMELEREAEGYLDRVARGGHPTADEIRGWVARFERLVAEAEEDRNGLAHTCLYGLNGVVGGLVANMDHVTWQATHFWLVNVLKGRHFKPVSVDDVEFESFLRDALAKDAHLGLGDALNVAAFSADGRTVRRSVARLVDEGLGYLVYDARIGRFTGGFRLHEQEAIDWLRSDRKAAAVIADIDVEFAGALPPEYAAIIRGVAEQHEMQADSILLVEDGLRVKLSCMRNSSQADWFRDRIEQFRLKVPEALQRRRVAAPVSVNIEQVGDRYEAQQAGAMGPGATTADSQLILYGENGVDLEKLIRELGELRAEMHRTAETAEQQVDLGAVAGAELALQEQGRGGARRAIASVGKWTVATATKLGLLVAAEWLKSQMK